VSQANNQTHLSIPREEARKKLNDRIAKAAEIIGDGIRTSTASARAVERETQWYKYNRDLLSALFTTRRYSDEYAMAAAEQPLSIVEDRYFDASATEFSRRLKRRIELQTAALHSLVERLELIPESPSPGPDATMEGDQKLELLIERFHLVAQQMRNRRQSRPPLDMTDEYDVQYLLYALLRLFFDDIRDEVWTPSYAGKASRTDFLLPEFETVVEAKKTRPSLTAGPLGDELLIDIARYQQDTQCRKLFCFVYDPDGYINNPRGVETDLSKQHGKLSVRVMIMPRS
jgi:hypothetical protein